MIESEVLEIQKPTISVTIIKSRFKPKPSIVYDTYWEFAAKRQSVFFKKIEDPIPPWTDDPILQIYKFTNAYRASDRVSQYLIKNVIYKGDQSPRELFFRIILFKIFNKIETWEYLKKEVGEIGFSSYNFSKYNRVLLSIKKEKRAIYSGAYIMASGKSSYHFSLKHENHLKMLEEMMSNRVYEIIPSMVNMEELYHELKSYPTIGEFLAYQFAIDINYSELVNFSEMEFVKAGPGAVDGIRKCFTSLGDYSPEDVIKMMADKQQIEFERLGIRFENLWGRDLQLIDCQNLFCEVDKYSRVAHPEVAGVSGRLRIKQKYKITSLKSIEYFFPPKWGINTNVKTI
jgi:hypothetical protein